MNGDTIVWHTLGTTSQSDFIDSSESLCEPIWTPSTWVFNPVEFDQGIKAPFHWTGLPTELKEHLLQFCLSSPQDAANIQQQDRRLKKHAAKGFGRSHDRGPFEIVGRLAHCPSLLRVSRQIRTLILRLCFVGRNYRTEERGFSIVTSTHHELDTTMRRLDQYYQLIDIDCIPNDGQTTLLAQAYRRHPRIYPSLKQYATFKHGIRSVDIGMSFKKYMHFFRVEVGSFGQSLKKGAQSYNIFNQMPNLSNITIRLPGKPDNGWEDHYWEGGPQIFHRDSPCPRILHRIIYERAAHVLASYKNMSMVGFMDAVEEQQFHKALADARNEIRTTEEDFEELYADCGGGIQLDEIVQPGAWTIGDENEDYWDNKQLKQYSMSDLHPPKCMCEQRCDMAEVWDSRQFF